MNEIKHCLIFLLVGLVLGGIIIGYFFGRNSVAVEKPSVKIERDTVTLHDTIPDYTPSAKDSGLVRWMVIRVPVEKATPAEHVADVGNMIHDTIEVEVPVTQKHYETENYQAWVSGYRPNLDSIEVYQKEKIITETVTVTQKAKTKHWGIGFTGGYGYDFNTKTGAPFVGVGVSYNIFSF